MALTPPLYRHTFRPDGMHYAAVVRWDLDKMLPPWCYRLLTPFLARAVETTGWVSDPFQAITYVILLGTLYTLWLFFLKQGLTLFSATVLTIIYAFSYPSRKLLHLVSSADPIAMLTIILGIWFILEQRHLAFGAIQVIGALNREVSFLLIPLAYLYWSRKWIDFRSVRKLLWCIPGFVIFVAIRWIVPITGPGFIQFYLNPSYLHECYSVQGGIGGMARLTYSTFGILWLTALLAIIRNLNRLAAITILFSIICFGTLFFAHNTSREMMATAPLLLLLTGIVTRKNPKLLLVIAVISIFHSLVKFGAISSWHPMWLLSFPLSVLKIVDLISIGFILLITSRKSTPA